MYHLNNECIVLQCWLPSYSLLEMIQREKGQRKVPGPVLSTSKGNNSTK